MIYFTWTKMFSHYNLIKIIKQLRSMIQIYFVLISLNGGVVIFFLIKK